MRRAERAIQISPGFSYGHHEIAVAESMHGGPTRAITHAEKFFGLSTFDPSLNSVQMARSYAALRLGQTEEAATWARAAADHPPTFVTILAPAALILAAADDMDGAKTIAARLRAMPPDRGAATVGQTVSAMSAELAALYRQHGAQLDI